MSTRDKYATASQPAQERQHDIERKHLATAQVGSLITASFGRIAVLLISVWFISACRGSRTTAASIQTTQIGSASSTPAQIAPREKIILRGVQFKRDGSGISPGSQPILDLAAELLKSQPDMKVYVDTYCDPIGGKQLNLLLSQQRAAAVTTYLEGKGIASDRLIPRGFGATNFVASNLTADGRAQNRRVELVPITDQVNKQASSIAFKN